VIVFSAGISMASYGSLSSASPADNNNNNNNIIINGGGASNDETTSLLITPNGDLGGSSSIIFVKEQSANFWSKLTFGWMEPLMRLGNAKKKLDPDDITHIPLPQDCQTEYISAAFEESWKEELKRVKSNSNKSNSRKGSLDQQPSVMRALFRAFGADYLIGGFILKFIHDSCIFVGPQVLNAMIIFLGTPDAPLSRGLWLTLAVTLSQVCMSFCLRHYFFKCYKFGLMIRTAVVVAVYQKALVLSAGERHARSLGEITNLISIDAQRLQELTTYLHAIWYSFFQIGLALFFLWQQL
jgi:hypothetical protein